jgi:hypothetical protein
MLDRVVFSCRKCWLRSVDKCIEFHVNSFDSYWEILIILKKISQISMYYVETRADNSGYTNHRVTCLAVMGSPFDSEQVCWVSFQCLSWLLRNCIFWRNSKSKRGNNSNKMLDGVAFSSQQIGVNTFYKCIEFQVFFIISSLPYVILYTILICYYLL